MNTHSCISGLTMRACLPLGGMNDVNYAEPINRVNNDEGFRKYRWFNGGK